MHGSTTACLVAQPERGQYCCPSCRLGSKQGQGGGMGGDGAGIKAHQSSLPALLDAFKAPPATNSAEARRHAKLSFAGPLYVCKVNDVDDRGLCLSTRPAAATADRPAVLNPATRFCTPTRSCLQTTGFC